MPSYTVKQVAALSGVSVRTLHFYDETGLLKPAHYGTNGYRFYEEPQLLMLQQILFYRELGFELKQIKQILGRADFEKREALQSHRQVLQQDLARTRKLIETIDKTLQHLQGARQMKNEEMFAGFTVPPGRDRFDKRINLGGDPVDCKLSARDTDGAMCVFEMTTGWPRHLNRDQDEWVYVVEGEVEFDVGEKRFRAAAGESVFLPRNVPHGWAPVGGAGRMINVHQPAGTIEDFLRKVSGLTVGTDIPSREQVVDKTYTEDQVDTLRQLFDAHGMDLLPPRDHT